MFQKNSRFFFFAPHPDAVITAGVAVTVVTSMSAAHAATCAAIGSGCLKTLGYSTHVKQAMTEAVVGNIVIGVPLATVIMVLGAALLVNETIAPALLLDELKPNPALLMFMLTVVSPVLSMALGHILLNDDPMTVRAAGVSVIGALTIDVAAIGAAAYARIG